MPEFRSGGLLFTSNFDSGNLAKVERVIRDEDEEQVTAVYYASSVEIRADYEYNVWTSPDCAGTPFENGNRSWFYFGVRGYAPNKLIKINIMNMNKQGKLYSQGFSPITKTTPGKNKWERIRDKPSYESVDTQFILRFTHRFSEVRGSTTHFAFCYPWSYVECQQQLDMLDAQFQHCSSLTPSSPPDTLYYHRELLCYSVDKLRVDLITITNCNRMSNELESRFDPNLFPDENQERCRKFKGKRVFFLSSRVHPGETPASHVFNGFLELILRPNDPRSVALRNQYVFKLLPNLNPDGVVRGHYRTDSNGVNLNRVYLNPDIIAHPTIYAAKSLIVYHHVHSRLPKEGQVDVKVNFPTKPLCAKSDMTIDKRSLPIPSNGVGGERSIIPDTSSHSDSSANELKQNRDDIDAIESMHHLSFEQMCDKLASVDLTQCSAETGQNADKLLDYLEQEALIDDGKEIMPDGHDETHALESLELEHLDRQSPVLDPSLIENLGNEGSEDEGDNPTVLTSPDCSLHLRDPKLKEISAGDSGVAFYVDLHGHASKRGCFIYGNYFPEEDKQVENMLFPKLISMNSSHFDFTGCNFTERNMYTKDKRDGMSKEGSGRVAIFKAIGIIHSYTLECNYNTGRLMNSLAPAYNDDGRATPPPLPGFPPKYTPAHYEEVGRAVAVSALDLNDTNPWSRLVTSELNSPHGVQEWVRRYLRSLRGAPRMPKNMTRLANKASSMVATATPSNAKSSVSRLNANKETSATTNSNNNASRNQSIRRSGPTFSSNKPASPVKKDLGPVRENGVTRYVVDRPRRRNTFPSTAVVSSTAATSSNSTVTMSYTMAKNSANIPTSSVTSFSECRLNISVKDTPMKKSLSFPLQKSPENKSTSSSLPSDHAVNKLLSFGKDMSIAKQVTMWSSCENTSPRMRHDGIGQDVFQTMRPVSNASSTLSIEEEKIHQLQMISDSLPVRHKPPGHLTGSRPVDVKSEPSKRRVKKVTNMRRRSASHSPVSNSGQKRGSNNETDSDAERKKKVFKVKKKKISRARSQDKCGAAENSTSLGVSQITLSPRRNINPTSTDTSAGRPPQIQSLIADENNSSASKTTSSSMWVGI